MVSILDTIHLVFTTIVVQMCRNPLLANIAKETKMSDSSYIQLTLNNDTQKWEFHYSASSPESRKGICLFNKWVEKFIPIYQDMFLREKTLSMAGADLYFAILEFMDLIPNIYNEVKKNLGIFPNLEETEDPFIFTFTEDSSGSSPLDIILVPCISLKEEVLTPSMNIKIGSLNLAEKLQCNYWRMKIYEYEAKNDVILLMEPMSSSTAEESATPQKMKKLLKEWTLSSKDVRRSQRIEAYCKEISECHIVNYEEDYINCREHIFSNDPQLYVGNNSIIIQGDSFSISVDDTYRYNYNTKSIEYYGEYIIRNEDNIEIRNLLHRLAFDNNYFFNDRSVKGKILIEGSYRRENFRNTVVKALISYSRSRKENNLKEMNEFKDVGTWYWGCPLVDSKWDLESKTYRYTTYT